jgi:hypothetical protein
MTVSTDDLSRDKLIAENKRLREALEWYAHPILPYAITQAKEPRSAVHADKGARARKALWRYSETSKVDD